MTILAAYMIARWRLMPYANPWWRFWKLLSIALFVSFHFRRREVSQLCFYQSYLHPQQRKRGNTRHFEKGLLFPTAKYGIEEKGENLGSNVRPKSMLLSKTNSPRLDSRASPKQQGQGDDTVAKCVAVSAKYRYPVYVGCGSIRWQQYKA